MTRTAEIAATGTVHESVLTAMLDLPWIDLAPPKSLDRADFSGQPARGLSLADGAATLTAFTAETIRLALGHVPGSNACWSPAAGGSTNRR